MVRPIRRASMNLRNDMLSRIRRAQVSGRGNGSGLLRTHHRKRHLSPSSEEGRTRRPESRPSLVKTFQKECERLKVKVHAVPSVEEARDVLTAILKEERIEQIMRWDSPTLNLLDMDSLLEDMGIREFRMGQPPSFKSADKISLGISGADYALADTGTLVLKSRIGQERVPSLLPQTHVAIIESDHILEGLDDLMVRLEHDLKQTGELGSCMTLISGPSKTADIEMYLVHGIHGPSDVRIILISSTEGMGGNGPA
jgi:L-lactate dehydrogenase complex protein LldG